MIVKRLMTGMLGSNCYIVGDHGVGVIIDPGADSTEIMNCLLYTSGKFDFLGFTHICGKTSKGEFTVKRRTSKKKLKVKRAAMSEWLKKNMHKPVHEIIKKLNIKLEGHFRYYGITGNTQCINKFRYEVIKRLFWTLNRRSQMRSYTWEDFKSRILVKMPIKPAKIYVGMYS